MTKVTLLPSTHSVYQDELRMSSHGFVFVRCEAVFHMTCGETA